MPARLPSKRRHSCSVFAPMCEREARPPWLPLAQQRRRIPRPQWRPCQKPAKQPPASAPFQPPPARASRAFDAPWPGPENSAGRSKQHRHGRYQPLPTPSLQTPSPPPSLCEERDPPCPPSLLPPYLTADDASSPCSPTPNQGGWPASIPGGARHTHVPTARPPASHQLPPRSGHPPSTDLAPADHCPGRPLMWPLPLSCQFRQRPPGPGIGRRAPRAARAPAAIPVPIPAPLPPPHPHCECALHGSPAPPAGITAGGAGPPARTALSPPQSSPAASSPGRGEPQGRRASLTTGHSIWPPGAPCQVWAAARAGEPPQPGPAAGAGTKGKRSNPARRAGCAPRPPAGAPPCHHAPGPLTLPATAPSALRASTFLNCMPA
jgi:hypothetical protein